MTQEHIRKSHALSRTLSLAMVPVLYLFSFPWILALTQKSAWPDTPAMKAYEAPWNFLSTHFVPVGVPMDRYCGWCLTVTGCLSLSDEVISNQELPALDPSHAGSQK